MSENHQPSVVEMAKVAITGLITSCSGVLIAIFAFANQISELAENQRMSMLASAGCAALALWLAILSAMAGYFSEGFLIGGEAKPFWWWTALGAFVVAWLLLGASFVAGGLLLAGH
ncbi:hypothetical protein [Brevundimonas diminuta]|uniref:hypothetical protein n=1 Tax=Brevundimonas diminuta TaxID=293 RepID=UPI003208B0BF